MQRVANIAFPRSYRERLEHSKATGAETPGGQCHYQRPGEEQSGLAGQLRLAHGGWGGVVTSVCMQSTLVREVCQLNGPFRRRRKGI